MPISYDEWCERNKDIKPLIRGLKSSLPEQYVGFYLYKVFGEEVQYQKEFDWLGRHSLDIYIPSLQLAIEYDGIYYHANKKTTDSLKTSCCRSHGVYLVHITEKEEKQSKSRKQNEVSYYFQKGYSNIDTAICDLCLLINKRYSTSIHVDVDICRDQEEIISYVQHKYYKKSIAYVWPESINYWVEEENGLSIYDVFYTDDRCFLLKCPQCGKVYKLHTRYFHDRKSLIPCDCEYIEIENAFEKAIRKYKEKGEIPVLDDSLTGRRLYDRMASVANRMWRCTSREEAELYKRLGFESLYIDMYLSKFDG